LTDTARLIADLDLSSIRLANRRTADRRLTARLRAAGLTYDPRRHRIGRVGPATTARAQLDQRRRRTTTMFAEPW
jgi:hypothetical protein